MVFTNIPIQSILLKRMLGKKYSIWDLGVIIGRMENSGIDVLKLKRELLRLNKLLFVFHLNAGKASKYMEHI